ncbi:hypothetical protein Ahy_A02g006881 [Arachis hypogaea]|uniref:Aminotransferase-like plant mobile domain-containing protein n=1 Tax=Arachis hypogaea TaxID=3818 RepID=A0A445EBF6_ARAHY|nr:hypothetical protein Ahy_A02g006881 [Arachis hypogaea]
MPLDDRIETFSELPQEADDEMVRRYARTYIMMLLLMQLFDDKSGTRLHIRWLPYFARLEDMGWYSWGLLLSHGYTGMVRLSSDIGRQETSSHALEAYDRFTSAWRCEYLWFYLPDVIQVVHPRDIRATTYDVVEDCDSFDLFYYHRVASGELGAAAAWRFLSHELLLGDPRVDAIPARQCSEVPNIFLIWTKCLMSQTDVVLNGDIVLGQVQVIMSGDGSMMPSRRWRGGVVDGEGREVAAVEELKVVVEVEPDVEEEVERMTSVAVRITVVTKVVTGATMVEVMVVRVGVADLVVVVMLEEVRAKQLEVRQVGREMFMVAVMCMEELRQVRIWSDEDLVDISSGFLPMMWQYTRVRRTLAQEDELSRCRSMWIQICIGGTPPLAFAAPTPAQPGPFTSQERRPDEMEQAGDEDEDGLPLAQRGQRIRRSDAASPDHISSEDFLLDLSKVGQILIVLGRLSNTSLSKIRYDDRSIIRWSNLSSQL